MQNIRLRPRKIAGAAFFNSIMLRLVLVIVLAACCVPSLASLDFVDLIVPGDPSDVLSAGLSLPSQYALYPDIARPASLVRFPSSLTARALESHPWRQFGPDPRDLGASSLSAEASVRGSARGVTLAAGASLGHAGMRFEEDGTEYSRIDAEQDASGFGAAAAWAKTRLGVSYIGSRGSIDADSTRLAGIENVRGSGIGFIASNPSQRTATVEAVRNWGAYRAGLLASRSNGGFGLRTIIDEQAYSAPSDTGGWRAAPYLLHRYKSATDMLLLDIYDQDLDGPVLVGRILAGAWDGYWKSSSAAVAHLTTGDRSRQLYSLQYSTTKIGIFGHAGGFLLPGLFNSVYTTKDSIALEQITARYGFERKRGNTAVRWSVMLAWCDPSGNTYSTKSGWLQPLHVITNERLRSTPTWVIAPSVGVGYARGGYHIDAGLSVFGGLATGKEHKGGGVPASPSPKNRMMPGYRWGITIRREF